MHIDSVYKKNHRALELNSRGLCILVLTIFLSLTFVAGCKQEDPEEKYSNLLTKATQYKDEQKYDEARITLLSAIDIKPNEASTYYELAEVLMKLKKFGKAVQGYQTVINLNPEHRDARLRLAAMLIAGGEMEVAETHVTKLVEGNPEDVDALLLKATLFSARKQLPDARLVLEQVISKEPNNAAAIASLGDITLREGDPKKAEELLAQALKLDPDNQPVRIALADLYSRQGRVTEAEEAIKLVLKQNPENTSLRYYFSESLLRRGLTDRALEQYKTTVDTNPLEHRARDRLFDIYINRKEPDKARELAAQLSKSHPDDPAAQYFNGRVAELDQKPGKALDHYIKALQGMPNFAPVFRRAGLMEFVLGKRDAGIEHLNQAVGIDAADVGARLALARHFFSKREFDIASEHITNVLKRYPRQMGANILKADIALIEGDLDRAEVIYRAVAKMFPTSPSTLLKLGFLEEKRNNPQKAIEIYQTTLKLDRSSFTAIKRLATIWAKTKGIDAAVENLQTLKNESSKDQTLFNVMLGSLYTAKLAENPDSAAIARKHFEDALAEDPNMLSAYFGLARLDAISEDFEAAETRYSEIVKRQPKHIPSRMLLAISQERLSKYKEAADSYREILKVAPRFGPALNNLAWILAEELNQDLNEAQRLAEMAKEEQPIEPAVADTLGWIYHKQGNSRSAIALIEEAVQVGREHQELHPEILYHLGVVRKAVGDIEGAKSALEESLKVGGDSFNKADEIKALLGSL